MENGSSLLLHHLLDNAPAVNLPAQNAPEEIVPVLTIDAFPEDKYPYGDDTISEGEECPICLEEYEEGATVRKFPCGHIDIQRVITGNPSTYNRKQLIIECLKIGENPKIVALNKVDMTIHYGSNTRQGL
ncbi:hypothetical protein F8388_023828 [Cannabis sativa]|uniref:RING-type domain-containing protein n=1 Tax=Cannabis sativa TaxID=3483 RepID=A0A7J6GA22_CANSA|nr:hypothetical protein F8388_023828 [Cannabis sativa]